jgi:sporulation protein YlmC with PRC-barrel domain
MRLSDLEGKMVRRQNGDRLGMVFEVRTHHGRVIALICGVRGLWQRLSNARRGRRVRWDKVQRVTAREIWID